MRMLRSTMYFARLRLARAPGGRAARGFSLLEVMVAIAILGLSLTAILASQGDSAAWNKHAANQGVAIHLARCKITEVEEELLKKGYTENDETNTDLPCCTQNLGSVEQTGIAQFTCDTKVERVTLPDPPAGGFGGADAGTIAPSSSSTPLGTLMTPGGFDLDAGIGGLASSLGGAGGAGGAGTAGMLSFVMGMVYPSLKPMMEASIRRVSVTVRWKEGNLGKEFELVEFVTNPQRGGFVGGMLDPNAMGGANPAGAGTAAAGTGTPAGGMGGTMGGTGATGGRTGGVR